MQRNKQDYLYYISLLLIKNHNSLRIVVFLIWLGREDSNPRMHGPKPCDLPLVDGPKNLAERVGFEPTVKFNPHTRLAGAHLQPTRSPLQINIWRRMRDSNPQGQSPAVFKTAVLPIRTNPPKGKDKEFCYTFDVKVFLS